MLRHCTYSEKNLCPCLVVCVLPMEEFVQNLTDPEDAKQQEQLGVEQQLLPRVLVNPALVASLAPGRV